MEGRSGAQTPLLFGRQRPVHALRDLGNYAATRLPQGGLRPTATDQLQPPSTDFRSGSTTSAHTRAARLQTRADSGDTVASVGLFGFLRKKDERAIPEPGTPEFEAAVQGSALPDSQSVSMGDAGWTNPD